MTLRVGHTCRTIRQFLCEAVEFTALGNFRVEVIGGEFRAGYLLVIPFSLRAIMLSNSTFLVAFEISDHHLTAEPPLFATFIAFGCPRRTPENA